VKFHDAPRQRQAEARAFGARIQLVEQSKNGFVKAGFNALPLIADKVSGLTGDGFETDLDFRRATGGGKFQRILHQVLQDFLQPLRIAIRVRQTGLHGHFGLPQSNGAGQEREHVPGDFAHGNIGGRIDAPTDARKLQQAVEQFGHLVGCGDDALEVVGQPVGAASGGIRHQGPGKAPDGDERAFEIVRHGVGESFQLGVFYFLIHPPAAAAR